MRILHRPLLNRFCLFFCFLTESTNCANTLPNFCSEVLPACPPVCLSAYPCLPVSCLPVCLCLPMPTHSCPETTYDFFSIDGSDTESWGGTGDLTMGPLVSIFCGHGPLRSDDHDGITVPRQQALSRRHLSGEFMCALTLLGPGLQNDQ